MPLTLFEFASPRFHLPLSNRMPTANPISKFASALKPWAAFTIFSATIPSVRLTRCSMNFSLISLPASRRIFSTILSMKIPMMTPIIPAPIYLLSTPTIQPISLKISKKFLCNSTINVPVSGTDTKAV